MPGKGERKYRKEDLDLAVKAGAGIRETAPFLLDYKQGKYACGLHLNHAITPEKEEALIACIVWMADHGFPLSRPIIQF